MIKGPEDYSADPSQHYSSQRFPRDRRMEGFPDLESDIVLGAVGTVRTVFGGHDWFGDGNLRDVNACESLLGAFQFVDPARGRDRCGGYEQVRSASGADGMAS